MCDSIFMTYWHKNKVIQQRGLRPISFMIHLADTASFGNGVHVCF